MGLVDGFVGAGCSLCPRTCDCPPAVEPRAPWLDWAAIGVVCVCLVVTIVTLVWARRQRRSVATGQSSMQPSTVVSMLDATPPPPELTGSLAPHKVLLQGLMLSVFEAIVYLPSALRGGVQLPHEAGTTRRHLEVASSGGDTITFTEYAPAVFRLIRARCGVSDFDFYASLRGSVAAFEGRAGEGKGGATFFDTTDGRFVLKTISKGELDLLVSGGLLRHYATHMLTHRDSLLSVLCALVSVRAGDTTLRVVVMPNLFARGVDERYDLKGATLKRTLGEGVRDDASLTRKDLDWLHFKCRMGLDVGQAAAFLSQLQSDCAFLERNNLMDYSLLVGMHRPTAGGQPAGAGSGAGAGSASGSRSVEDTAARDSNPGSGNGFRRSRGGFQGSDGVVYYLGIIDFLQRYNMKKKLETAIRGLRYDKQRFSAVDPGLYSSRFRAFMANEVLRVEGENGLDEAQAMARRKRSQSLAARPAGACDSDDGLRSPAASTSVPGGSQRGREASGAGSGAGSPLVQGRTVGDRPASAMTPSTPPAPVGTLAGLGAASDSLRRRATMYSAAAAASKT